MIQNSNKSLYTTKSTLIHSASQLDMISNNIWPFKIGAGCCSNSYSLLSDEDVSSNYLLIDEFDPESSDVLIVSGTINNFFIPYLIDVYKRMTEIKFVLAIGTCSISSSVFESYSNSVNIGDIIPVDVYLTGCPPSKESISNALNDLSSLIKGKHGTV